MGERRGAGAGHTADSVPGGLMDQTPSTSTDLQDYLRPIWSRKWMILLIVVAATAATYYYYSRQPKVYQASTVVYLQPSALDQALGNTQPGTDRNTQDQSTLIQSRAVAGQAAKLLHYRGDPGNLLGQVTASAATGADFVTISATASTPDQAARIANAFVTGYDNFLTAQPATDATNSLRLAQQQLQSANNNPAAKKDLQDRIRRLKV